MTGGVLHNLSPLAWRDRIGRLRHWRHERVRWSEFTETVAKSGAEFAEAANRHIAKYHGTAPRISHDGQSDTYVVHDDIEYRFTSPSRLKYFLNGIGPRGRMLFDEYLLGQVPFEDGDTIVESGGNDGDFSLALRETGRRLSLISFEPSPREYRTLVRNLERMPFLDSAEAHQLALWNRSGETLPFYVKSATADSSVLAIDDASEVIEVETVRLDEVLPRRRYRLLKLEAEGAEPEILEGATGILDCFEYVTADVGFERGLSQDSTLPQVANLLIRHGFRAVHFGAPRHVMLFVNETLAEVPEG